MISYGWNVRDLTNEVHDLSEGMSFPSWECVCVCVCASSCCKHTVVLLSA